MKSILRLILLALFCVPVISNAQCPVNTLPTDTTLCEGYDIVLHAGNPGATYSWGNGETTESITVTEEGEYTVTITDNGCPVVATVNVTTVPALWSDFSSVKISDCLPVRYKFNDLSTVCNGTITDWFWEFGDETTSTEQNPEHDFPADGQYAIKLTVTDNNGNSIKRSKKINVVSSSVSIDLGKDTTICFGSSVTLDAGNPGYTYLWSTGESSQQISVLDDGEYSVIISKNGCEAKDTVIVTTAASVTTKWGYDVTGNCLPITVKFTDSSEVYCGQTITDWAWDFGDGFTSTEQHPEHIFYAQDTFQVKLTITTSNGLSSSRTRRIGIANEPLSLDIPSTIKLCSGESTQIDAGIIGAEYAWSPAGWVSDTTIRNPFFTPESSTAYMVEVKKCMVVLRDTVQILLDSIEKPRILQNGNTLRTAESTTYEWFRDGQKLGAANASILRIDRQGFYSVKIFNQSGCSRQSDSVFFMPKTLREDDNELVIRCSPNPSKTGQFSVIMSQVLSRPAKLAVYDRFGRILYTSSIKDNVNPLSMLKLSKGMYFVNVTVDYKRKIIPVIVQ